MFFIFLEGFLNSFKAMLMVASICALFFAPIVLGVWLGNAAWMLLYIITIPIINGLLYLV